MPKCSSNGPRSTPCRSKRSWCRATRPTAICCAAPRRSKPPSRRALATERGSKSTKMKIDDPWRKVTGDEEVILADLSELTDGQTVKVAQARDIASEPTGSRPTYRPYRHGRASGPLPGGLQILPARSQRAAAADLPAAGGAGGMGADGGGDRGRARFSAQLPWQPHCGQTHSTVHFLTGTSFVTGCFTSLCYVSEPAVVAAAPGNRCCQLSPERRTRRTCRNPAPCAERRDAGNADGLRICTYTYTSVTFFVVQEMWQTGTSPQPQCGQQLQHVSPPVIRRVQRGDRGRQRRGELALSREYTPTARRSPSRSVRRILSVMFIFSCCKVWILRPAR